MSQQAARFAEFQAFRKDLRAGGERFRNDAIGHLLEFSTTDLARATDRDWRTAGDFLGQLHAHAWHERGVMPPNRLEPPPAVSRRRIRQFHKELNRGLTQLFPGDGSRAWERQSWEPPMKAHRLGLVSQHRHLWRTIVASWPDTTWVTTMSLLEEFGRRIYRCPSCPEGRLFVKSKRQLYCSPACSQRARSKRWYATHKRMARELRQDHYDRQVPKGRHGRMARRARTTG